MQIFLLIFLHPTLNLLAFFLNIFYLNIQIDSIQLSLDNLVFQLNDLGFEDLDGREGEKGRMGGRLAAGRGI